VSLRTNGFDAVSLNTIFWIKERGVSLRTRVLKCELANKGVLKGQGAEGELLNMTPRESKKRGGTPQRGTSLSRRPNKIHLQARWELPWWTSTTLPTRGV